MAKTIVSLKDETWEVLVEGEIDITNIDYLAQPLEKAMNSGSDNYGLIIDFFGVTYIDSAVLELIVKARNKMVDRNKHLQVTTRSNSQPDRVLRTCRFDTILDLRSLDIPVYP